MRSSRFYSLAASFLILGLIASALVLPTGYTYSETCSSCGGDGSYVCPDCRGSGKCWVCGGTGRAWFTSPNSDCVACKGSGICSSCEGLGWYTCGICGGSGSQIHWMFNLFGSAAILSIIDAFLFLGLFAVGAVAADFYLSFNNWVYQVADMGFWFNRSFMVWLFAKDRKRWAKWEAGFSSFGAVYLGAFFFGLFSYRSVTGEIFIGGVLLSILAAGLFSWLFYRYYTSEMPNMGELNPGGS